MNKHEHMWYEQRRYLAVLAAGCGLLAFFTATWAIDTASLWLYALTFVLVWVALRALWHMVVRRESR